MTCEICHKDRPTMVSASAFGPMSHAICTPCLQRPAESLLVFNYLYDEVAGGDPSKLDKAVRNWYTWIDGRYVHWDNYVIMRQQAEKNAKTP